MLGIKTKIPGFIITCLAIAAGLPLLAVAEERVHQALAGGPYPDSSGAFPPVDCVVGPHKVVDLASPVPGVIETVHFERSDFVKQDEVVAFLSSGVEKASVELARQRAIIEAEVHLERINLSFAQRQQARIDSLFGKKAVSYQNKDEADREAELSMWKLQQATDLVRVRELELNRAQQQLEQKTIRSPITGFVVRNFKSIGEYVEDQPILRVAQLDPLKVEAIVPMELFGKIREGMTATIQLEALNFPTQQAEVTIVDRMGDAASGTFGVRLELPNPDYTIPAGLKCGLEFHVDTIAEESTLPPSSNDTPAVSLGDSPDAHFRVGAVTSNLTR